MFSLLRCNQGSDYKWVFSRQDINNFNMSSPSISFDNMVYTTAYIVELISLDLNLMLIIKIGLDTTNHHNIIPALPLQTFQRVLGILGGSDLMCKHIQGSGITHPYHHT